MKKSTKVILWSLSIALLATVIVLIFTWRANKKHATQAEALIQSRKVDARYLARRIYIEDSLTKVIAAQQAIAADNGEIAGKLNELNLGALGIVVSGWNVQAIRNELSGSGDELPLNDDYCIYDQFTRVFTTVGYKIMKAMFIAAPTKWESAFNASKETLAWLKKKLGMPNVNESVVPYLNPQGIPADQRQYFPAFIRFYLLHSKTEDEGLFQTQLAAFEKEFLVTWPNAFDKDEDKVGVAYKNWRSSYVIKNPVARMTLGRLITAYNAL